MRLFTEVAQQAGLRLNDECEILAKGGSTKHYKRKINLCKGKKNNNNEKTRSSSKKSKVCIKNLDSETGIMVQETMDNKDCETNTETQ